VAAVAAHLMQCEGFTLGEALERVLSRCPCATHPDPALLARLVQQEVAQRRGGAPSDLRGFPSLPRQWQFITWRDPLRAAVTLVSCHGRILRVTSESQHPRVFSIGGFMSQVWLGQRGSPCFAQRHSASLTTAVSVNTCTTYLMARPCHKVSACLSPRRKRRRYGRWRRPSCTPRWWYDTTAEVVS